MELLQLKEELVNICTQYHRERKEKIEKDKIDKEIKYQIKYKNLMEVIENKCKEAASNGYWHATILEDVKIELDSVNPSYPLVNMIDDELQRNVCEELSKVLHLEIVKYEEKITEPFSYLEGSTLTSYSVVVNWKRDL